MALPDCGVARAADWHDGVVWRKVGLPLVLAIVTACGSPATTEQATPTAPTVEADKAFTTAVDELLHADSFVVLLTGGDGRPTTMTYQAPDRLRSESEGQAQIAIGDVLYMQEQVGAETSWVRVPVPGRRPIAGNILFTFELLQHAVVVPDRDWLTFTVSAPGAPDSATLRGKAQVRDGHFTTLIMRVPSGLPDDRVTEARYEFSRFNSAPSVDPPPPEQVHDAPPVPTCDEGPPSTALLGLVCQGGLGSAP